QYPISDKVRRKHAVAMHAWHPIFTIDGQMQIARKQSHAASRYGRHAGCDDGTMLILITREEMGMETIPQIFRNCDLPRLGHRDFTRAITLSSLMSGVSRPL